MIMPAILYRHVDRDQLIAQPIFRPIRNPDYAIAMIYFRETWRFEMITRDSAWELLTEYTKSDSLRKHALAVEFLMRAYALKYGEDVETWGIVGMLHDFDYEMYPTIPDHPLKGAQILRGRGFPEEMVHAIASHAGMDEFPRNNLLCRTLFACDELAGFLTASALVRPGKSIMGMEARSVRKKLKDKAFARSVNRADIVNGAAELGVDLDEHITFCIAALQEHAAMLGLDDSVQQ
jgi:putative nucleotidyltransferase with HDIG domain